MTRFLLYLLPFCFLTKSFSLLGQAKTDENLIRHQAHLGYPIEIGLSLEIPIRGIHFSYNPTIKINQFIAAEGQLSYSFADFRRNNATFSRDGGNLQSLNFLVGGRLLLFREEQLLRFYGNIMLGGFYYSSSEFNTLNELNQDNGFGLGLSLGLYALIDNHWSAGVSVETRNFVVFKVGYIF